jgi:hypothetical protein
MMSLTLPLLQTCETVMLSGAEAPHITAATETSAGTVLTTIFGKNRLSVRG